MKKNALHTYVCMHARRCSASLVQCDGVVWCVVMVRGGVVWCVVMVRGGVVCCVVMVQGGVVC